MCLPMYCVCYTLSLLPKDVEMIVKFAEFEYKMGDPSRGQTLFENVVANYPKRLDVWSRYFDMSIKQPDKETTRFVRHLLECLNITGTLK